MPIARSFIFSFQNHCRKYYQYVKWNQDEDVFPVVDKGMTFIAKVVGDHDKVSDGEEVRELFEEWVHRVYGESHAGKGGPQRTEHRDEADDDRQLGIYRE